MPSCDGSNCGACACACDSSLERENRNLQAENERLRERLKSIKVNTKITKKGKIFFTNLGNINYVDTLLIFSI